MDKQEAAFKAWLNTILLPEPAAGGSGSSGGGRQGGALASRRLAAKVRGLLWRIYQRDEQFRDAMLRVEERVMGGALRMRDEVGGRAGRRCQRHRSLLEQQTQVVSDAWAY